MQTSQADSSVLCFMCISCVLCVLFQNTLWSWIVLAKIDTLYRELTYQKRFLSLRLGGNLIRPCIFHNTNFRGNFEVSSEICLSSKIIFSHWCSSRMELKPSSYMTTNEGLGARAINTLRQSQLDGQWTKVANSFIARKPASHWYFFCS